MVVSSSAFTNRIDVCYVIYKVPLAQIHCDFPIGRALLEDPVCTLKDQVIIVINKRIASPLDSPGCLSLGAAIVHIGIG